VKFLLNMNVPRELARRLNARGHLCRHVGDIGMGESSDVAVVEEAAQNREVIVTHDLDYGRLLSFSAEPCSSVIIFRLRNTHPHNLLARFIDTWTQIERPLLDGAIVVVEDAAVRIRASPQARDGTQ
jgi:predicted nuclease of predicted toxin-antitoxin system